MSKIKGRKPLRERVRESLSRIELDQFKKVSSEFLDLRNAGKVVLDTSLGRYAIAFPSEIRDEFLKKYGVSDKMFSEVIELLVFALDSVLSETEEEELEKLKDRKDLVEKAKSLFLFAREKLDVYPEIKSQYLVTSFCKTRFLQDMDWEIDLKTIHPKYMPIKLPVFPVCILKLMLGSTRSIRRGVNKSEPDIITIELSLDDINNFIKEFSVIRDEIEKLKTKKLVSEGT